METQNRKGGWKEDLFSLKGFKEDERMIKKEFLKKDKDVHLSHDIRIMKICHYCALSGQIQKTKYKQKYDFHGAFTVSTD